MFTPHDTRGWRIARKIWFQPVLANRCGENHKLTHLITVNNMKFVIIYLFIFQTTAVAVVNIDNPSLALCLCL